MKIGICGTGRMGAAIAQRVMAQGHDLTVWNRDRAKTQSLVDAGARHAESPAALVAASDIVIVMLLNDAAMQAVYHADNGLLKADLAGRLIIDMSTVLPETMVELGTAVTEAGGGFVECPVGGTVGPARDGKLFGLAGGSETDFARALPLLEQLCRRTEHVGKLGAGAAVKLAVNLPLMVYLQALAESLTLCKPLGLPPERLIDILADTPGAPPALKMRAADIVKLLVTGERAATQFSVSGGKKDLLTAVNYAKKLGTTLPVAASAAAVFAEAEAAGLGDTDVISGMPAFWSTRTS
ncbi:NAD(P)-dependent oxidoreductase [Tardiphaga sp.]|jgi:3-hydroxyisobutyrate dehydrogenase|uniref:NAD(P)-dependent oxidoreductase n=1 Tax=Tardiphaga sp. TaxID=1926292 RepID=UPI0019B73738|nr:NAD(P)-dependent oxidoreductase [Tardiphaga sp.]MBC7576200.1 NAD(P)-dependent oxidoreductase [Tardiphaga sp.]